MGGKGGISSNIFPPVKAQVINIKIIMKFSTTTSLYVCVYAYMELPYIKGTILLPNSISVQYFALMT